MRLEIIKKIVESIFDIDDLSRNTRKRYYVYARNIYMDIARQNTKHSFDKIGSFIKRDHSTVIYGIKSIENILTQDDKIRELYGLCLNLFNEMKKSEIQLNEKTKVIDVVRFYRVKHIDMQEKYRKYIKTLNTKLNNINKKINTIDKSKLSKEILSLNEDDYVVFEERSLAIIKSLKLKRTYQNTHKSNFNVKTSRECIDI